VRHEIQDMREARTTADDILYRATSNSVNTVAMDEAIRHLMTCAGGVLGAHKPTGEVMLRMADMMLRANNELAIKGACREVRLKMMCALAAAIVDYGEVEELLLPEGEA